MSWGNNVLKVFAFFCIMIWYYECSFILNFLPYHTVIITNQDLYYYIYHLYLSEVKLHWTIEKFTIYQEYSFLWVSHFMIDRVCQKNWCHTRLCAKLFRGGFKE